MAFQADVNNLVTPNTQTKKSFDAYCKLWQNQNKQHIKKIIKEPQQECDNYYHEQTITHKEFITNTLRQQQIIMTENHNKTHATLQELKHLATQLNIEDQALQLQNLLNDIQE